MSVGCDFSDVFLDAKCPVKYDVILINLNYQIVLFNLYVYFFACVCFEVEMKDCLRFVRFDCEC